MADAFHLIDSLRDQLAIHDKSIGFLFGAGTSAAVPDPTTGLPIVPAIAGLTAKCSEAVDALGDEFAAAWKLLSDECNAASLSPNIETLLSKLRIKIEAVGETDKLLGLDKTQLTQAEDAIRRCIAACAQPAMLPEEMPHHAFARWVAAIDRLAPVEVFTTNYDLLFERAFEDERVPTFDGFVGAERAFFSPASLSLSEHSPGNRWLRLWKLHGSVNWEWVSVRGRPRIVRTAPTDTGELILPSVYKYDESRLQPYAAFIDRFRRFLDRDDVLLVTAGYSFGDEHINEIMFSALREHPRTSVVALMRSDPAADSAVRAVSLVQRNLSVFGASRAIVSGEESSWTAVADVAAARGDLFSETSSADGLATGRVSLGDFGKFCGFLSTFGETG